MKKITLLITLAIIFTSCSIQEKMVVKENLQAEYSIGFDMSSLMKMESKDKEKSASKSKAKTKEKKNFKKIDSTFFVKDILAQMPPDSLAKMSSKDQEKFKLLENFNFKMKKNEEKKEFAYSVGLTFDLSKGKMVMPDSKSIGDVLVNSDKKAGGLGALTKSEEEKEEENKYTYFYDGKIFKRTADKPKIKKVKKATEPKKSKKEELKAFEGFGADLEKMFKENNFKMEYTFPKTIKTVSIKGAIISADKKTFTLTVPFENIDDFQDTDFEVIFE